MHTVRRATISLTLAALLAAGGTCAAGAPALALDSHGAATSASAAGAATSSKVRSWAAKEYGTFAARSFSGTGDDVVTLPKSVKAAVVTATHDGESNFVIEVLDKKNETTDLVVNEIGAYTGSTAFGLRQRTTGRRLQVTADGDWTITLHSIASAKSLPKSGRGDDVRLYNKPAGALRITHRGESNFAVWQHSGGRYGYDLLVNEIGDYKGTVPTKGGPSVIEITADGTWTITRK